LLQNGRNVSTTGLRQIGQDAVRGLSACSDMMLDMVAGCLSAKVHTIKRSQAFGVTWH